MDSLNTFTFSLERVRAYHVEGTAVGGHAAGFFEGFEGFAADFGFGVFPEGFYFGEDLGVAAESVAIMVEELPVEAEQARDTLVVGKLGAGGVFLEEGWTGDDAASRYDAGDIRKTVGDGCDVRGGMQFAVEDHRELSLM